MVGIGSNDGEELLAEYGRLVATVKYSNEEVVTPSLFKRALGKVDARFNNSDPQDAHELLMLMISELKKGIFRRENGRTVENLSLGKLQSRLK